MSGQTHRTAMTEPTESWQEGLRRIAAARTLALAGGIVAALSSLAVGVILSWSRGPEECPCPSDAWYAAQEAGKRHNAAIAGTIVLCSGCVCLSFLRRAHSLERACNSTLRSASVTTYE